MSKASANNIRIEYETFGDPSSPPILLIIGLGGQLIYWDEEFCSHLAEAVPGAELKIIQGMGHDLPHGQAWAQIAKDIIASRPFP